MWFEYQCGSFFFIIIIFARLHAIRLDAAAAAAAFCICMLYYAAALNWLSGKSVPNRPSRTST